MEIVSGKIKSKKVKSGTYGDLVIFTVGSTPMSVFANDKKLTQEAKDLIRDLSEGDEAEFSTYESVGKDGKKYTNISGVVKVSRLDYGRMPQGDNADEPVGHSVNVQPERQAGNKEGDTKVRSMALAYAKDWGIALLPITERGEGLTTEEVVTWAKRFEQYILTGE